MVIPWCDSMVIPYIGHHKALDETRKALSLHRTVTDLIFPHIRSNLSLFQIFSPAMCGCSLDLWMSRSFPRKPPHFILTSKFKKTTHQAQNASHDYHQATRDPRVPDGQTIMNDIIIILSAQLFQNSSLTTCKISHIWAGGATRNRRSHPGRKDIYYCNVAMLLLIWRHHTIQQQKSLRRLLSTILWQKCVSSKS